MGEIVNLNKVRKKHNRALTCRLAAENRVRHGRSRAEKAKERKEAQRTARSLDYSKLEHK
ncbi:MAG TPA: DUF4169 family protein [Alphaproteobacteria bacterium]|nr:DUF4169 family protein [Alphaproteobacteria bacterium]